MPYRRSFYQVLTSVSLSLLCCAHLSMGECIEGMYNLKCSNCTALYYIFAQNCCKPKSYIFEIIFLNFLTTFYTMFIKNINVQQFPCCHSIPKDFNHICTNIACSDRCDIIKDFSHYAY